MQIDNEELSEIVRVGGNSQAAPSAPKSPFVWILLLIAALPIGFGVWVVLYEGFFEGSSPIIEVLEEPKGIGANPVTLRLRLKDDGAGLDELSVSVQQKRNPPKQIFTKQYHGAKEAEENISIGGDGSGIERGSVSVEVKLFDRGFWSSAAVKRFDWKVDFQRPSATAVSTMHNGHIGGTQLVFYKVLSDDISASGVKAGENFFEGIPASGVDPEFKDGSLRAAIYALDIREAYATNPPSTQNVALSKKSNKRGAPPPTTSTQIAPTTNYVPQVKIFAKNYVNNLFLGNFYNLAMPRRIRTVKTTIRSKDEFPPVLDDFTTISKSLRPELVFTLPFLQPKGVVALAFGDEVTFTLDDKAVVGKQLMTGYLFRFGPNDIEVPALSNGYVLSIGKSRKDGYTVVIDHGMGLVTIYDRLDKVAIKKGDKVTKGQAIGQAAQRRDSTGREYYLEMRVQGVPVDPREWWDERWGKDHITKKILEVKRTAAAVG